MKIRISSNKISQIISFAHSELDFFYQEREVNTMIYSIIEHFCSLNKAQVLMQMQDGVLESELINILSAINKLKCYVPLQYILKSTEFLSLNIKLNHKVLIPRPETEELVSMVIEKYKEKTNLRIADLCCGSGCIALALKKYLPSAQIWAYDLYPEALAQTRQNAQALSLDINVVKADILQRGFTSQEFDIVISNPPYVTQKEKIQISRNVLDYEPEEAIFVRDDSPLIFYEAIADFLRTNLVSKGECYLEINPLLSTQTGQTMSDFMLQKINDFSLKERFLRIKKK